MTKKQKHLLVRIIVAAVLFAAGGLLHLEGWAELGVYLVCYAVIGWDIVWKAITNILHGQVFDENFLMTIATVGALILGEHSEGRAQERESIMRNLREEDRKSTRLSSSHRT